jgi:hypothetical protein
VKRLPRAQFSPAMLPAGVERGLRPRTPGAPERSAAFLDRYERNVLFYDVYWHEDGQRIILQGPPPVDLADLYRTLEISGEPGGERLGMHSHHSANLHLYSVRAPQGTTHLSVSLGGTVQTVAVGPNQSAFFANTNLLATVSRNNDLRWIGDWARFHVVNQGANAVLLFDNQSDRYSLAAIEETLAAVSGLERFGVVSAPFRYTGPDNAIPKDRFWAHFLQPALFTNMLRRYGAKASGILNCDVDELAVPLGSETVFEAARRSWSGSVYFRSAWVEPVPEALKPEGYRHSDFRHFAASADYRRNPKHKWALDPARRWLKALRVHAYAHKLRNGIPFARGVPGNAFIAHFRGISTSWKYDRPVSLETDKALRTDPDLDRALARAFP